MDSSASDASSEPSASPSPPASPEASIQGPPTLERLVVHFVAAKRSLGSTSLVLRANEIVTSSRRLIEEVAILNAKNISAQRGIGQQVETLHIFQHGIAEAREEADREFESIIAQLDEKHARLEKTLDGLKGMIIDARLHARGPQRALHKAHAEQTVSGDIYEGEGEGVGDDGSSSDSPKTLYEFIDETTHTDLLSDLRNLLDTFQASKTNFNTTLTSLSDSTTAIENVLHHTRRPPNPTDYEEDESNPTLPSTRTQHSSSTPEIPTLFRTLESQAAETATLLSSLISHHDLCVTALKHTEGGGTAAKAAIQAAQTQGALSRSGAGQDGSLYAEHHAPISDEERSEMLHVLENDAAELEDVVGEIRDLSASLEESSASIEGYADRARSTWGQLQNLVTAHLGPLRARLPDIVAAAAAFRATISELATDISDKSTQLADLTTFYAHFSTSYKALLKEVERRNMAEAQMAKVAAKAQKELERLWEGDRELRGEFVEEVGRFLPRDLWPELGTEGKRWIVRAEEMEEEEEEADEDGGKSEDAEESVVAQRM